MTDATDRSRREATHRQLCAITAPFEQDALDVMIDIADRMAKGRDKHGDLDIDGSPRDFDAEADEEALDQVAYRAMARIRRIRRERAAMLADLEKLEAGERGQRPASLRDCLPTWSKAIDAVAAREAAGIPVCSDGKLTAYMAPEPRPRPMVCNRFEDAGDGYCKACGWASNFHPALVLDHDRFLGETCHCAECAARRPVDPFEITGVEDSAPLAVECEKSRAIGAPVGEGDE